MKHSAETIYEELIKAQFIVQAPTEAEIFFRGETFGFWHQIQKANKQIVEIFDEHLALDESEKNILNEHKSLLFLQGLINTKEKLESVQRVTTNLLQKVATGVYFEHCGTAYTAKNWHNNNLHDDIMPWINFIYTKKDLWTLGLAALQSSDIKTSEVNQEDLESKQNLLLTLIEAHLNDEIELESGLNLTAEDGINYITQKTPAPLFKKGDDLYNPKGCLTLIERK